MIREETQRRILKFRDDRDWRRFHTPKDLAISLSLEAAEVLEVFQWSGSATEVPEKSEALAEEIADVMIYCEMLCDRLGFSADAIINRKMTKNEEKYDVNKAKGKKLKYTEL